MKKSPTIALTMGDPAGVGPEVILKAFAKLPKSLRERLVIYGDIGFLRKVERRLGSGVSLIEVGKAGRDDNGLRVVNTGPSGMKVGDIGAVSSTAGLAAMRALETACDAIDAGEHAALVTAPINKEAVALAGYHIAGHTEFLAERTGSSVAMMMASKKLNVVVATTHIPLAKVVDRLSLLKIFDMLMLMHHAIDTGSSKGPRIAVCGLNPHASDGGTFGNEERKIIAPAIAKARKAGVRVTGPHPADTLFTEKFRETYDVALAMYHDQGLIPVKALSFGETVNITLGLPYLRVSVDHGTAFDIAGSGQADPKPMIHAIRTAFDILAKGVPHS